MSELSRVHGRYTGETGAMFDLALRVGVLTLITLGIYRFWGKSRLRRYIWSSTQIDGDSFEYTGTGLEKFLGFLLAVVVLAVYLGIVQLILFFFGLMLFQQPQTQAQALGQLAAIYITLLALLPLIFFASYRARRYRLARTRWRGIRFGMDKAAWGYVWRAILHSLLSAVTLGIMLPRQTYHLEKYMTDRSWFGDTQFQQSGKWTQLYGAMTHVFIAIGLIVVALGIMGFAGSTGAIPGVIVLIVAYIWLLIGMIHYQVQSFAYLTSNKCLGEEIGFDAQILSSQVIKVYILGGLAVGILSALVFGVLAVIAKVAGVGMVSAIVIGVLYLFAFVLIDAMTLAWITQPIITAYVSGVSVINIDAVAAIGQREADAGADAEGFADALDIGAAV